MYPQCSAGGSYFLPLSMPLESRRSTSSVRIISLTPPGVSTNEVLHYVIDDIVNATVNGIIGCTPQAQLVRIFMDVVGFVGDYPASSKTVDLIGHVGSAPCTLCSFRRLPARLAQGSRFRYTTEVHANHFSFLRQAERHNSLIESNVNDNDANRLGLIQNYRVSDHSCTLIYLQQALNKKLDSIPVTEEGNPVVSGLFDPYSSNIGAPDHLLTGLSKDVLNASYRSLPSNTLRTKTDV